MESTEIWLSFAQMNLAPFIEHTLLKPDARENEIRKLCTEAIQHGFFGVCVNSSYVALAKSLVKDKCRVVSVIGFPLGTAATKAKVWETSEAVENGADEVDMVIHLGLLKDRRTNEAMEDIQAVVKAARGKNVKVIIETALITTEEKTLACELARDAGAHFVKTCTGFAGGGATVSDVELMRAVITTSMGVKASGGIKTAEAAEALVKAGASRLGTSSGVQLIHGQTPAQGSY